MMDLQMLWFVNCYFEGLVSMMVLYVPERQVEGKARSIVCLQVERTVAFDFFNKAALKHVYDDDRDANVLMLMRRTSSKQDPVWIFAQADFGHTVVWLISRSVTMNLASATRPPSQRQELQKHHRGDHHRTRWRMALPSLTDRVSAVHQSLVP
jgi:hypothetical protein